MIYGADDLKSRRQHTTASRRVHMMSKILNVRGTISVKRAKGNLCWNISQESLVATTSRAPGCSTEHGGGARRCQGDNGGENDGRGATVRISYELFDVYVSSVETEESGRGIVPFVIGEKMFTS